MMKVEQDVYGLLDCFQAVSDDGEAETDVVLTDSETEDYDDASWVQCVQTVYELN